MNLLALVLVIALLPKPTLLRLLHCPPCKCFTNNNETVVDCERKIGSILPSFTTKISSMTDKLLLGYNSLTHLGRNNFTLFQNLTHLDISSNLISRIDKGTFSRLNKLEFLSLEKNNLHCGTRLANVFEPLVMLKTLKLNGNVKSNACGYPGDSLKYLKSLSRLYIDGRNASFDYNFKQLTNLTYLNLSETTSYCHIRSLDSNMFTFLPTITHLNISNCELESVDWDSLSHLGELRVLDISNNHKLTLDALERITFGIRDTKIRKLYVNNIAQNTRVCVILYNRLLRHLQNTSLEELHLNKNRIEFISNGSLNLLPKTLRKMFLRENRLTFGPYLKESSSLSGLEEIDVSGKHGSHDLPVIGDPYNGEVGNECSSLGACQQDIESLKLKYFNYYNTESKQVPLLIYDLPPKLTRLKCSYYQLAYNITEIGFNENSLTHLDLSSNLISSWTGPIYGLENLTYLNLSNNIAFQISSEFLHRFFALKSLDLSYNILGRDLSNDTGQRFKNLYNLRVLNVSHNFIVKLRPDVFSGLKSLEIIDLSSNNIHDLFIRVSHMKKLHVLRCRNNQVRWIPHLLMNDLESLAKTHKVTLDLSENPIACTCENLHLLRWFFNPPFKLKFGNLSNYFCMFNDGTQRYFRGDRDEIYDNLSMKCHYYFVLAQCVLVGFVLVVSAIFLAVAYRYRWKLRYWYYAIRLKYSRATESGDQGNYEFDAFVSFADEDRDFVVEDLVTKLETEAGLRLNIHQRDFTPGRSIAQNIVNAVQISKRTLVILSEDFLASTWCRYELEMANMEQSASGREVIIIVMYRSVKSQLIPSEVTLHIMNDTFMEYPHQGDTDMFWKSLTDALKR